MGQTVSSGRRVACFDDRAIIDDSIGTVDSSGKGGPIPDDGGEDGRLDEDVGGE